MLKLIFGFSGDWRVDKFCGSEIGLGVVGDHGTVVRGKDVAKWKFED